VVAARTRCGWRCPRRTWSGRGLGTDGETAKGGVRALPGGAAPYKRGPAAGVRRAAQDRLRQDPGRIELREATLHDGGREFREEDYHEPTQPGARPPEPSYATGPGGSACWATPSPQNLDRAIARTPTVRRWSTCPAGGAGRTPPSAARWTRWRWACRPRVPRATGRHLGGQLPGMGAGAVRHRPARRVMVNINPGVPAARVGVRAQPCGRRACWSPPRAPCRRLLGDGRRGPPQVPGAVRGRAHGDRPGTPCSRRADLDPGRTAAAEAT